MRLFVIVALACLSVCQAQTTLYGSSITENPDNYVSPHVTYTLVASTDISTCNIRVCTTAAEAFSLNYADQNETLILCVCDDPVVSGSEAASTFSLVPTAVRSLVKGLTIASVDLLDCTINTHDYITIGRLSDCPAPSTNSFLRASAFSLDASFGNASSTEQWATAVASDTCVPANSSTLSAADNFADVFVVWYYIVVSGNTTSSFWDCMHHQLQFMEGLVPASEITGASPTEAPTETPTETPTNAPTEGPTNTPTEAPTEAPTSGPTGSPSTCPITVEFVKRASWNENGKIIAIYDVTLINNGADTIANVELSLSVTPRSLWSLTGPSTDGLYTLPSWLSDGFPATTALTFGFIAPEPDISSPPTLSFTSPSSCAGDTATPPAPPSNECGNVTFTSEFIDGWTDGITPVHMWQTTISNTGPNPITQLDISGGAEAQKITQLWNLDVRGNHYTLPAYAIPLSSSSPHTFGYIVSGLSTAVDFEVLSFSC